MCHKTKINFNSLTGSFYLCIFSHSIPRGWYVPYNKNWFQFFDWIFLFMYLQSLILYPVVDMSHTTKIISILWLDLSIYVSSVILYPVADMSHTTKIDFNSLTGSFYLCIFRKIQSKNWNYFCCMGHINHGV